MRYLSAVGLLLLTASLASAQSLAARRSRHNFYSPQNPATVAFCDMVNQPQFYFDKTVRLTAIFEQATEGQYLSDNACPLSHDEQIGVGYADTFASQGDAGHAQLRRIQTEEFGGRARVRVVGILRNASLRAFSWYHYRFDIIRFEEIEPVVVAFAGDLQAGLTYRAAVKKSRNGLGLASPLRFPEYQAIRLEWSNLNRFPSLRRLRQDDERMIVFSVISDKLHEMTDRRWNRTVVCKVIRVE